jgi:hypothetical protein
MRLSECPVRVTIDVIEGKWKPIIINALKQGTLRFGQLRRQIPEATRKVLTEQLRELEDDRIGLWLASAAEGLSGTARCTTILCRPDYLDSRGGWSPSSLRAPSCLKSRASIEENGIVWRTYFFRHVPTCATDI